MFFRYSIPQKLEQIDLIVSQTLRAESVVSLLSAFSRMRRLDAPLLTIATRDKCIRPILQYNNNYNPFDAPNFRKPVGYSLYVFGKPLFDDRPLNIFNLRRYYIVEGITKKLRIL